MVQEVLELPPLFVIEKIVTIEFSHDRLDVFPQIYFEFHYKD